MKYVGNDLGHDPFIATMDSGLESDTAMDVGIKRE